MKQILLDLFCKAGGTSVGFSRAGFDVVGIDIEPQKRYPFDFLQADALAALRHLLVGLPLLFGERWIVLDDIAVIAASPPCQKYSTTFALSNGKHPDLVAPVRDLLLKTGKPYIIENVPGAPLVGAPLLLCGTMFDLRVVRHRYFENTMGLWIPPEQCNHWSRIGENGFCSVFGTGASLEKGGGKAAWALAMAINWMSTRELSQAIPPAYTEYIGRQIIDKEFTK